MKKICLFLFGILSYTQVANAQIDENKAVDMIKELTTEGIERIINSNASQQEKNNIFKELFVENLDLDFIGKYVLGRYWRTANAKQRREFIDLYKEFNVKTWSKRFDEFKGHKFVFNGTSKANNPSQIFVNTQVPMEKEQPISVNWRIREHNGNMKIIDIIIENVSLAQTSRSEYTSFISKSQNGIEDLLKNLKGKINQ